jgi:MFS family permease
MFLMHKPEGARSSARPILPWWLVGSVAVGTLLNPLNSSMIAVALVSLGAAFHVSLLTATWLVSSFYLAGAAGQPLMGRLADLIGPRRIFCLGLLLVGMASLLSLWTPTFGWLVVLRVLQALGASAAYPAGLALFRAQTRQATGETTQLPAAALGAISMTSNVSAALGPTLGGVLLLNFPWQALFLINVPLVVIGLILALLLLPKDQPGHALDQRSTHPQGTLISLVVRALDVPGVVLFSGTLTSLLIFLLALEADPPWLLLPVFLLLLLLLLFWEERARTPFLNMKMLRSNHQLVNVYVQFAAVNLAFYSLFFGLPLWLEQARGESPALSGLLMLPLTGMGVLTTFAAVQIVRRAGARPALVLGALALGVGTLLLLFFQSNSPVVLLLAVIVILGIPNGLQNLGLQAVLYQAAPAADMGVAAGQFQTFRYLGSILSTSLLGLLFGGTITSSGLHVLAGTLTCISMLLLVGAWRMHVPGNDAARSA